MEFLKKLNHWLYQVERVIVVISLVVMSVVVFLSVVHRRYADPESVLANKIAKLIDAERDSATWQQLQDIAGPVSLVLLTGIIYLGFRTASRRPLWKRGDETGKTAEEIHGEPLSHLKCAVFTVATVLASWLLMVLLFGTGKIEQSECIELRLVGEYNFHCGRFPAGLAWAQPFGLILTLWVAFLGASMATKDNLHLKVEAVQQALPDKLKRISGLLSGILTAGFCLLLAYLGWRYVLARHEQWEIANHLGGLHDGIDIPYFVSFSVVPIAYLLMAARFVGVGVLAFRGELEDTPAELRDLKKKEAEEAARAAAPVDLRDPAATASADPTMSPDLDEPPDPGDPPEDPLAAQSDDDVEDEQ